jgi:hypothetical protein
VYPTKKIIPQLRPKSLIDWRTGGRALLVSAMAVLEGRRRLRKRRDILNWQAQGFCGPSCGYTCAKEKRRILCGWKIPGTEFEHFNKISDHLVKYKGLMKLKKPLFQTMRPVAQRNAVSARFYSYDLSTHEIRHSHFIRSPEIDDSAALYDGRQDPAVVREETDDEETRFIMCRSFHL